MSGIKWNVSGGGGQLEAVLPGIRHFTLWTTTTYQYLQTFVCGGWMTEA